MSDQARFGVRVSAYERQELIQLAIGIEQTRCRKIIDRFDRRHVAEQFIDVDAEIRHGP